MATSAIEPSAELLLLMRRLAVGPDWANALAERLTDAIVTELPELAADDDLLSGTRASTRSVAELLPDVLLAGSSLDDLELPGPAAVFARELARRGVPLDTLLRSYFLGHGEFARFWADFSHQHLADPAAIARSIEDGSAATFAFLGALTRGLVERYGQERERWVRSADAVRAETVRALVAGTPVDLPSAEARLGYPLDRRHVALIAWRAPAAAPTADTALVERATSELLERHGHHRRLVVPMGDQLVFAWVAVDAGVAAPVGEAPADLHVAVGAPADGPTGFVTSHRQASEARRVARLGAAAPAVTSYADVALTALCTADLEHAERFVRDELGALGEPTRAAGVLRDTLRAYLEEQGSARRAARRLGVHENTVANRLASVEARLDAPVAPRGPELLVALRLHAALQPR